MYFLIFTVIILGLLWVFQFFFLKSYYQSMKINEIKKAADQLVANFGRNNYDALVSDVAYKTNSSIEITDSYGTSLYSREMMAGNSYIHKDYGTKLFKLKAQLHESKDGEIINYVNSSDNDTKMLVYGTIIGSKDNVRAYLFINCSLEPVLSTTNIIKKQLLYITIIIFELACIITMFISKRLSEPIVKMTKKTKELAKGNYNVKFEGGDYQEIQDLADVLNYAEDEISKVDGLRRDLVSNISHDLRTPLTIIKGYAEMIRDLSGDNKVKREEHIGVIIDECDRLSGLVDGILELSKYESDNKELKIEEFDTKEFIDEVMERYKIYEQRDGYVFKIDYDEPVTVKADRQKILQVMYNFINNAINYTGDDKTVKIVQINRPLCVRFEITDTGIGIEKENLPLIFDRYYREKKTAREVAGTGLGLSIVKEILKLHKFQFGVISKYGSGSTFWFEISR